MSEPAIILTGIGVRYRIPVEKISSFKEHAIRLVQGRVAHRDLWALRDVDLTVRPGELFGIVGRNGAGKSTLLKLVARVLEPTAGRLVVRGRMAPMLELGAGFHPDLTGEENVALYAGLLGHRPGEVAALLRPIVEFAELEGRMHLPVRQYSGGMLARLGFAVATATRPDVLIIDEVLAVGDAPFQDKCLARIRRFRQQGTTILLVSHAEAAIRHCDRALLLADGRVEAVGAPAEICQRYRRRSASKEEAGESGSPDDAEADDRLIRDLRRRSEDPRSVFCTVRLFAEIREQAIRHRFDLDRTLELGPGGLPGVLLCLLAVGSSRAATTGSGLLQRPLGGRGGDTQSDDRFFEQLKAYLAVAGGFGWWRYGAELYAGDAMSSPICWNDVDVQALGRKIEILGPEARDLSSIADASFTFAFSIGSFEHRDDPEATIRQLRRILVPGGGTVHEIHLAPLDAPDPLADLRLDEEAYREVRRARPAGFRLPQVPPDVEPREAYQNRWRTSDYVRAFERAGFRLLEVQPVVVYRPDLIDRQALAEPFRSRPLDDLSTLVVRIVAARTLGRSIGDE